MQISLVNSVAEKAWTRGEEIEGLNTNPHLLCVHGPLMYHFSSEDQSPYCVSHTSEWCVTYTSHFCFSDVIRCLNKFHLRKKGGEQTSGALQLISTFVSCILLWDFKALSLQWNCMKHVNKWHPGSLRDIGVGLFRKGFPEWGSTLPSTENSVYHFGDAIKITNVQSKPNSLCYLVFEIHKYVKQKTSNRPFYPGNSVHIIFLSLVQKLPRELWAHPSSI